MTEKEKTLELVIDHFITTAEKMSKSKDQMVMISASQGHWAAIETAGLGAHVSTIDRTVREYLKDSKDWLFGHDKFKLAVSMTLKGASKEVAEEVLAVAVKHYSWIWPVELLTAYIGRRTTAREVFAMVEAERKNTATLSEESHKNLIRFARKYVSDNEVRRIEQILDEKTTEFNSHSD